MNRSYPAFAPSPAERSPPAPPPRPCFTRVGYPYASPASPTPPALRAPPPPPGGGGGSHGDTRWKAVSGSPPGSPHGVDRGDIAMGGGDRGGGNPLPAGGYPYVPPQSPRPPFGGQYVGIPREKPSPGIQTPGQCEKQSILSSVGRTTSVYGNSGIMCEKQSILSSVGSADNRESLHWWIGITIQPLARGCIARSRASKRVNYRHPGRLLRVSIRPAG